MKRLEEKLEQFGSKPGLSRMKPLMEKLGNPQDSLQVILIGGTNGKGSTAAFLSSILSEHKKKVGSFYSPHVSRYNERFRINNKPIDDEELSKYEDLMIELFDSKVEMTMFEALSAIAYLYFKDNEVDFAVMEVGMGGEYDATNIAKPILSILTNVDLDHTQHLGNTKEEITKTKAGIFKNSKYAICGMHNDLLAEVEKVKPVKALGRDFFIEPREVNNKHNIFSFLGKSHYSDLVTKLLGRHQIDNAACAIAAAECLLDDADESAIREGLMSAENSGRFQQISDSPKMIIDAAHNPAGIGTLISTLPLINYEKLIVVFGAQERKDWRKMIALLGMHADLIIANKPKGKPVNPGDILKEAQNYTEAIAIEDIEESITKAKEVAKENDLIVVCGSIYMLGDVLNLG
jgi:dihydrofolate synthase/folylpolyglutamate synthase